VLTKKLDEELGWADVSIEEEEDLVGVPLLGPYPIYFLIQSDDVVVHKEAE
jgi:hypothetical protein